MANTIEPGDHVHHHPTGEDWVVRYVKGDRMSWLGWPPGEAKLSDCLLIKKADAPPAQPDDLIPQDALFVCGQMGANVTRVRVEAAQPAPERQELSKMQNGRPILEASTGMHGDVAKEVAIALCAALSAQPAAQPVQLTDDVIDAQLPHGMAPHSTLVGPVEIRAFARKIAALQPQGWVLVPMEPTDEMVEAAWDSDAADYVGEHKRIWQVAAAYRAMIAARPDAS